MSGFKRWLEKWYPQDADVYDTYKKLRREWCPYKVTALQIAALMIGLLIVAIPSMIYYDTIPYDSWWQPVFGIVSLITMVAMGMIAMVIANTIYDKRSAKPTPPRTS